MSLVAQVLISIGNKDVKVGEGIVWDYYDAVHEALESVPRVPHLESHRTIYVPSG